MRTRPTRFARGVTTLRLARRIFFPTSLGACSQAIFKCMKGFTAPEFKEMFVQRNSGRRRSEDIIFPRPETNLIWNSIRYRRAIAWNSQTIKETTAEALNDFKRCLRKFDTDEMNFEPILALTKTESLVTNISDRFLFSILNFKLYICFSNFYISVNYCLRDPTSTADKQC